MDRWGFPYPFDRYLKCLVLFGLLAFQFYDSNTRHGRFLETEGLKYPTNMHHFFKGFWNGFWFWNIPTQSIRCDRQIWGQAVGIFIISIMGWSNWDYTTAYPGRIGQKSDIRCWHHWDRTKFWMVKIAPNEWDISHQNSGWLDFVRHGHMSY